MSTGSLGEGQANQEGLVLATRIWVYRVILSDICHSKINGAQGKRGKDRKT